jgi:hypothetical protein
MEDGIVIHHIILSLEYAWTPEGCGARLCGTGPSALLPDMQRRGGRYPLGVPMVPGRSSPNHDGYGAIAEGAAGALSGIVGS